MARATHRVRELFRAVPHRRVHLIPDHLGRFHADAHHRRKSFNVNTGIQEHQRHIARARLHRQRREGQVGLLREVEVQ